MSSGLLRQIPLGPISSVCYGLNRNQHLVLSITEASLKELHTLEEFHRHTSQSNDLSNTILQNIDLTQVESQLSNLKVEGCVFLGCDLSAQAISDLCHRQALIFPAVPNLPFEPYRAFLYKAEELFDGFDRYDPMSYCQTPDNKIYQHWRNNGKASPTSILEGILRRIHDQSITDALLEFLDSHSGKTVAIMGGHSMRRDDHAYRDIAHISRSLAQKGFLMVSGGGPGAMEATHLGAWLSHYPPESLDKALAILSEAPHYQDKEWLACAYEVRETFPRHNRPEEISLGIPTWLYGHEPPNPFATHIAKYFNNSLREDGLVTIAHDGIVFSPGSAGTIQEIFQDACQNHYLTTGYASPMVFLGQEFWTKTQPIFPLLRHLSKEKVYHHNIALCDSPEEVLAYFEGSTPIKAEKPGWSFCEVYGATR